MPDWLPLRRLAQQHFRRITQNLVSEEIPLPSAEMILRHAQAETGIFAEAVGEGDVLLAQAHAVLDRRKESIWYDATLPSERLWLVLAHEFAHYWLHPDLERDQCQSEETLEQWVHPDTQSGAVGYSPLERREREANLFAVELLLPTPVLRQVVLEKGWTVDKLVKQTGLPEQVVLVQMLQAVLLPPQSEAEESATPSPIGLDASQRAAATSEACPLLVEAGPGTGKTRTLIARLCHLIQEKRIAPENILALTFSNKAAQEMRTRLRDTIGIDAERVWIGTFHSFGLELLRKEGSRIGLPLHPRLLETADAILLLERELERLQLDEYQYLHQPNFAFPDILRCISRAKDELQTPQDYQRAAEKQLAHANTSEEEQQAKKTLEVARFYSVYQEMMLVHGYLDFGDLIMKSVELLDTHSDVRNRWQTQYPHILADEYQDINRASAQLLRRLAGSGRGFWAVGDVRQAIYRFRGASPANLRQFEEDFPGGQRLRLEVNYRSAKPLVDLFSSVATQMSGSSDSSQEVQWEAHRKPLPQPAITLAVAEDDSAQADQIANLIQEKVQQGVPLRQQAILCRTNRQASDLAQRLEAHNIPTLHLGSLFERSEIKDLLALLSLATEPHGSGLARVATFPEYAIPQEDVQKILTYAKQESLLFPSALGECLSKVSLSPEGVAGVRLLWLHIAPIASYGSAWLFWTRYLLLQSHYLMPLLASSRFADQQRLLAIYHLLEFARNVQSKLLSDEGENTKSSFLFYLRHLLQCGEERSIRSHDVQESLNGVALMTIHTSKGLEYISVYLPNLINGQFPPRKRGSMAKLPAFDSDSSDSPDDVDDGDECLFFVALSRARDHLVLSYPTQVRGEEARPAPLLQKLAPLLGMQGVTPQRWESQRQATPSTPPSAPPVLPRQSQTYTLSAVHLYQDCPRRYYYQYVRHLPERREHTPYRHYFESLNTTTEWLREERLQGRQPTLEEAEAFWKARWESVLNLTESPLSRILARESQTMLSGLHQRFAEAALLHPTTELLAELEMGNIRLKVDQAERLPDGKTRLIRHKRGRPKDEDHRATELALLRHAAQSNSPNGSVEIELFYPKEGIQREVPEKKKLEERRVERYEQTLREMQTEEYPARPDDRKCPTCPFLFICPS